MFHGVGIMSRTYPLLPAAGERTGRRLACLGASESWDRLGGLPRALWGVVLGEGAGQVAGTYFRRHRVTHETAVFFGRWGGENALSSGGDGADHCRSRRLCGTITCAGLGCSSPGPLHGLSRDPD